MLITAVENFVLFSTLLAVAAFGCAWIARRMWRHRPDTLTRVYTIALILPPVASAWLVAAALLPESWLGEAAFDAAHSSPLHELHLLGGLTASLEPALAYATIMFTIAAAMFAAWSSLRGYWRVGSVIARLEMKAAQPPPGQLALVERVAAGHGLDVGLVMSDYPFSFVWGFRRSKLVLSSGLLNTLTPEELAGVLEHEVAHHARRDNLFKLALTMCIYASVAFPLSRLIFRWREAEVEMVCDEVAAARTSSPLEIADALVKIRRRTLAPAGHAPGTSTLLSSFVPNDTPNFERRVHRLVAFAGTPPDPAHAAQLSRAGKGSAFFVGGLLVSTHLAVSIYAPMAVHHATEYFIQIVK